MCFKQKRGKNTQMSLQEDIVNFNIKKSDDNMFYKCKVSTVKKEYF